MTDAEILGKLKGMSVSKEEGSLPVGMILGDWRITAFLARGGTSEVYCAEHLTLKTPAAIKFLFAEATEMLRERFIREAKLLAELKSVAFPRFFAYGEKDGHPYLVEELLEPRELPTTDCGIASYIVQLCKGLAELHNRGIVHRDLKPSNILFRKEKNPVIVDLGLSSGEFFGEGAGTPGYSAPEQFIGERVTPAADIHALGVLANACFGEHPPCSWREIIRRATSSIVRERYASVEKLARAIRYRNLRRWIWMALGGLALLAFFVVGFARICEPHTPDVIELKKRTIVWPKSLVLHPGQTVRIVGPGTLDAVILGDETSTLWMTNCVVLNRAKTIFPKVGLKYKLTYGVYLNFTEFQESPMPDGQCLNYLLPFDRIHNECRFQGPENLADLSSLMNMEYFRRP